MCAEPPDPGLRLGYFHPLEWLRLIGPLKQTVATHWRALPQANSSTAWGARGTTRGRRPSSALPSNVGPIKPAAMTQAERGPQNQRRRSCIRPSLFHPVRGWTRTSKAGMWLRVPGATAIDYRGSRVHHVAARISDRPPGLSGPRLLPLCTRPLDFGVDIAARAVVAWSRMRAPWAIKATSSSG